MRYAVIKRERARFTVKAMCRVLKVSRSGFYGWLKRRPSKRAINDALLLTDIKRVHAQLRQNYGLIKCWKTLQNEGVNCGRDRVAWLRRSQEMYANAGSVLSQALARSTFTGLHLID